MIIDRLENADRYNPLHSGFAAAFEALREIDFESVPDGTQEIDGDRLTMNVIRSQAKRMEDVWLEVHRRYIDIQYLISGEEQFGWQLADDCEMPMGEYNAEKDTIKYEDIPEGWFPLLPGAFAIFFPEDAHAPMLGEGPINKVVLKVAVDW
ncbi:MAG: YhcH/YjgK/YiaL family protein [Armatimonadota bacterium]